MAYKATTQSASANTFSQQSEAQQALLTTLANTSTRLSSSIRTRKPKIPKPVYPEKYNQHYRIPAGIEEQPF